jgi:hypothetical protein
MDNHRQKGVLAGPLPAREALPSGRTLDLWSGGFTSGHALFEILGGLK